MHYLSTVLLFALCIGSIVSIDNISKKKTTYESSTLKSHLSPPKREISVSKESIVEFSAKDATTRVDHTKKVSRDTKINKRNGHEYGPPSSYYPSQHDPEPIIEIIIKDSNESLPAVPQQPVVTAKPTKEPVQVFYVKYKKNPNSYGKEDEIIYEPPVPALTPPTNHEDIESENYPATPSHTLAYSAPAPRPSTTLRTIIRPDSEIYHGTGGVKVTFGKTEIHPAPIISHRDDSPTSSSSSHHSEHVSKRDSSFAGSDIKPVRRNPEYRSPILNQNEFQALPPDFNKQIKDNNNYNGPFRNGLNDYNNNIKDYAGPIKSGPNEFNAPVRGPQHFNSQQNNGFDGRIRNDFNAPIRNVQNFENPIRNTQIYNGPIRNGQSFDNPLRNTPNNFDGPVRNTPNFNSPPRNGPNFENPIRNSPNFDGSLKNSFNNFDGPPRNGPNNYNKQPSNDLHLQQATNHIVNRPNPKVAFPTPSQQTHYQRPLEQSSAFPKQPLQPQYQQKPFIPSQPIYSQQELIQPPSQYQQNSYTNIQNNNEQITKRPIQYQQQQQTIKTPPIQQFNTFEAIRPQQQQSNYQDSQNQFINQINPNYVEQKPQTQQQYLQDKPKPDISSAYYEQYTKPQINNVDPKIIEQLNQQQQQQYLLQLSNQKSQQTYQSSQNSNIQTHPNHNNNNNPSSFQSQQQQIHYTKSPLLTNNVENQNNLFITNSYADDLNSIKPGTELSNEEYQILLEKQRLQQIKLLQKDREQSNRQTYKQNENHNQEFGLKQHRYPEQQQKQEQNPPTIYRQQQKQEQNTPSIYRQEQQQSSKQEQNPSSSIYRQDQSPKQEQTRHQETPPSYNEQIHSQHRYRQQQVEIQNSQQPEYHSKPSTLKYVSLSPSTVKYQQISSSSTTASPQEEVSTEFSKEQKEKYNKNLLALPDEVPEDLRKQLLSSGILGNADIQILDYDKVGDIPIESLPPEALANFYNSGGGAQSITKRSADFGAEDAKKVEMKVVKYDPATSEGQKIAESYIQSQPDATLDPVILNDSSYNRYLPLKVNGASFPLPNSELLKNRRVTSVVVLAPVDYETVIADQPVQTTTADHIRTQGDIQTHDHRDGKAIQVQGVHFISGNILNDLVKNPTSDNYKNWLQTEKQFPINKQSIVLLVTNPNNETTEINKEVFMYDFNTENINELKGDLSETFLQVAESNASSEDLENVSEIKEENDAHVSKVTTSTNQEGVRKTRSNKTGEDNEQT